MTSSVLKVDGRINNGHKKGVIQVGRSAASPEHHCAVYWKIKSPSGLILEGWNLNHLVRQNSHLFAKKDVVWKTTSNRSKRCLASQCLSHLFVVVKDGAGGFRFMKNSWK